MVQTLVYVDRVPATMTLTEFTLSHHNGGLSRKDVGDISTMQHTVTVRYEGQFRKGGGPATDHFLCVQHVVASLDFGVNVELIALGHDLIEDGVMSYDEIRGSFGTRVAKGIWALSKRPEHKDEPTRYCQQILKAAQGGLWEVVPAKLADRAHNLRTLDGFDDLERELKYLSDTADNILRLAEEARPWIRGKHLVDAYEKLQGMVLNEYEHETRRLECLQSGVEKRV